MSNKQEDGGGGGGGTIVGDANGNPGSAVRGIGSSENVSLKDFVPVSWNGGGFFLYITA